MGEADRSDPRVALARLRAVGVQDMPVDRRAREALHAAATTAGRRLVETTTPDDATATVTLGWQEGSEPVAGGDSRVARLAMPDELVLTFASALRACWPDPELDPYPGRWAAVETVLEARALLGTLSGNDGNDGRSVLMHRKGALRRLRQAGCLSGDETRVRLGPIVATWSEGQVAVLRTVYDQLPVGPVLGDLLPDQPPSPTPAEEAAW